MSVMFGFRLRHCLKLISTCMFRRVYTNNGLKVVSCFTSKEINTAI